MFRPGELWLDAVGQPIQAHGGGILYHAGRYYWFGEQRAGPTYFIAPGAPQSDFTGIACYSSDDLVHWNNEGLALSPNFSDPSHDLHPLKKVERPKVLFHALTHQFVLWMHIDNDDYSLAHAGVAISATPTGPYQYLGSFRPNGWECRDLTLFLDQQGTAYVIFASDSNRSLAIVQLTDDYLQPTSLASKHFVALTKHGGREAPAMFAFRNQYGLITSGCTGWQPNAAEFATAPHPFGPWTVHGNPCRGQNAEVTFGAQSTAVVAVKGQPDRLIFMADQWNVADLADSRYVWLPITMNDDVITIAWQDEWALTDH